MLDLQMLFDPLNEKLDLPATAVHFANFITCQIEAIGDQEERIAFRIMRLDHPEFILLMGADSDTPVGGNLAAPRDVIFF